MNDFLFAEEQRPDRDRQHLKLFKNLKQHDFTRQVEAVLQRMAWLVAHDAELETGHVARRRLATLLGSLHKMNAVYDAPALCRLLDLTVPLLGRIAPYGPVDRVGEYLRQGDLTPGLCAALRGYQANLREEMSINAASMLSLRQHLHVLLWLDEWDQMNPAHCWSECVRRDFRAMTGDRRDRWRALLKHIRGNAPVRMPASWARDAKVLLTAVTLDDFRDLVTQWFAPFRTQAPLPLSVAGSHVLKGLIWYCAVSEDAEAKKAALGLLEVKWKQKRNIEKAMAALAVFGVTKEQLLAENLIKAAPTTTAAKLIDRLTRAPALHMVDHIQQAGDDIIVQGQMHFYRLSRTTGEIVRVSDGATLELNWPAVPDTMRFHLHRECDSEAQVAFRASLLAHDATFGQYFQPKK